MTGRSSCRPLARCRGPGRRRRRMRRRADAAACPGRRRAVLGDDAGSREERGEDHPPCVGGRDGALVGPAARCQRRRPDRHHIRRAAGCVPAGAALRDAALLDAAAARAGRGIALQDGTKPSVAKVPTGAGDAVELRWETGKVQNATRFLLDPRRLLRGDDPGRAHRRRRRVVSRVRAGASRRQGLTAPRLRRWRDLVERQVARSCGAAAPGAPSRRRPPTVRRSAGRRRTSRPAGPRWDGRSR